MTKFSLTADQANSSVYSSCSVQRIKSFVNSIKTSTACIQTHQSAVYVEMACLKMTKSAIVVGKRRVKSWSLGTAVMSEHASCRGLALFAVFLMVRISLLFEPLRLFMASFTCNVQSCHYNFTSVACEVKCFQFDSTKPCRSSSGTSVSSYSNTGPIFRR